MTAQTTVVAGCALLGVAAAPALTRLTAPQPPPGPRRPQVIGPPGRWRRTAVHAVLAAAGCGAAGAGIGPDPVLPAYLCLALAAVVLTVIDVEQHRLPDRIMTPTFAVGFVVLAAAAVGGGHGDRLARVMLAAGAAGLVVGGLWWISQGGVGFGDVKASAMIGLFVGYLGWGQLAATLAGGFALVAAAAVVLVAAAGPGGAARCRSVRPCSPRPSP